GLLGPPRPRAAHQRPDTSQVMFGDGQLVGLQVVGHRELQARVGFIPVEADGSAVVLGAVSLRLLRSGEGQPVHRLEVVVSHAVISLRVGSYCTPIAISHAVSGHSTLAKTV